MSKWTSFASVLLPTASMIGLFAAGCGGHGSSGRSADAGTRDAGPCVVGEPAGSHIQPLPVAWRQGPGTAVLLACQSRAGDGGAALVGFAVTPEVSCVTVYSPRLEASQAQSCDAEGPWTENCEGDPGCVRYFVHERAFTELDGPLEPQVRKVRIWVHGKPLENGVMVAHVEGRKARAINSDEPFGYFAALIPGCVPEQAVKVDFIGAHGSRLDSERGWDVSVPPCHKQAVRPLHPGKSAPQPLGQA